LRSAFILASARQAISIALRLGYRLRQWRSIDKKEFLEKIF
jgi:hypothetical protein